MAFTTATSQQTTNSTTSNVTLPASVAAGDLVIGFIAADSGAGSMTWPSPWVSIRDSSGTGFVLGVGYLIASGGETTVAVTHTTERSNHIALRIPSGEWHGTTAPEFNTVVQGTSTTPDPGSATPSWGSETNNIWIAMCFADDSATPFPITGWPTNYGLNQTQNSTATSAADVAIAIRLNTTATEDAGAFTMTGSETWNAYTMMVRPAGAAAVTSLLIPHRHRGLIIR